ncbi:Ground-like domain-containing protein [Aphelenchoides bicaudatus]|nr:Ground-like domain-containing protein [Aphelenchoides bicaudatus]
MASRRLLSALFLVVQFSSIGAFFFGTSCPQTTCQTSCPVCSPCGGNNYGGGFYPSGGNNYGGLASYPTQYAQPSYGNSYAQAPSYAIGQPSFGYAQSPSAQIPQFSANLPPLISAPSLASLQGPIPPADQEIAQQAYQEAAPPSNPSPPSYIDQSIVQPTTASNYQSFNENTQTEETHPAPERVTPTTRGYLDVDVQPISATTFKPNEPSGYGEAVQVEPAATSATTTQQTYKDDHIDYLEPTGLDDSILGRQNNDQPTPIRQKKTKVQGVKNYQSDPARCNSDELKQIMEEEMVVSPSIAKRRIQQAASKQFNGSFNVVCSWEHFSYVASTQLFCEITIKDLICFAFLNKFN